MAPDLTCFPVDRGAEDEHYVGVRLQAGAIGALSAPCQPERRPHGGKGARCSERQWCAGAPSTTPRSPRKTPRSSRPPAGESYVPLCGIATDNPSSPSVSDLGVVEGAPAHHWR